LEGVAAGAATFTFVPAGVLGLEGRPSANERLNIAAVGVGGMGKNNVKAVASENIVALCDVDEQYAGPVFNEYPNAKKFRDYRKMLDQMDKQIDAVIIATPDHTHAVVAMECMKRGKHVYVQKPLTRTVYEARMLTGR
jgi:predicted dehydrogenase